MFVLGLLREQMNALLGTGKTNPDNLRDDLETQGLMAKSQPLDLARAVASLQNEMRGACGKGRFSIQGTTFELNVESLHRLPAPGWFNDQLILACLHLAQKHSYIRVGLCVPLHREVAPHGRVAKPFERAALQIQAWTTDALEESLVCLFPLFQHNNHFSLLEINLREDCVRHYDSLAGSSQDDVRVRSLSADRQSANLLNKEQAACSEQFPELRYISEVCMATLPRRLWLITQQAAQSQKDSSSCGPLVVSFARRRMLNRPLQTGDLTARDASELRADALRLIREAWSSGALVPVSSSKKRRAEKRYKERRGKRRRENPESTDNSTI